MKQKCVTCSHFVNGGVMWCGKNEEIITAAAALAVNTCKDYEHTEADTTGYGTESGFYKGDNKDQFKLF